MKNPAPGIYIRDLDPNKHAMFKAACARRGRSMRGVVTAFIEDVINPGDGTGRDGYPKKHVKFHDLLTANRSPR